MKDGNRARKGVLTQEAGPEPGPARRADSRRVGPLHNYEHHTHRRRQRKPASHTRSSPPLCSAFGTLQVQQDKRFRPEPPRFVGRKAECRALDTVLTGGRAALIRGEAGIGKSALIGRWLSQHTGQAQFRTQCNTTDESYSAIRRLWRHLPISPRTTVEEVLDLVTRELAIRGRCVLIVDDFHWADVATRQLVRLLCGSLPPGADLLIATRPVARLDEQVLRTSVRLDLLPLNREELTDLVASSSTAWTPVDVKNLESLTSGLPLLVVELIHRVEIGGPGTLLGAASQGLVTEHLVEQLLESVSRPTREFLAVAALLDATIDVEASTAVLRSTTERISEFIDEACTARLLDAGPPLRFRHDLVRTAIVDALQPGRRAQLHKACAEVLSGRSAWISARHLLRTSGAVPLREVRRSVLDAATSRLGRGRCAFWSRTRSQCDARQLPNQSPATCDAAADRRRCRPRAFVRRRVGSPRRIGDG